MDKTGRRCFGCVFILSLVVSSHGIHEVESVNTDGGRIVCYVMRSSFMPVTDIPGRLCTHIIVAFAEIKGLAMATPSFLDEKFYRGITKLKSVDPSLSVMISLHQDFTEAIQATASQKQKLAINISNYLKKYDFDGVDFDFEPLNHVSPQNKQGYMDLIQMVRKTLDDEMNRLGSGYKQISAALMPSIPRSKMYDVPRLAKVLDFATAMTYDYHLFLQNVNNKTGYNSPLYAPVGEAKDYCVNGTIKNYLDLGMPASKLLLGLPTYGRSYTLSEAVRHGLHAPAVAKGMPGPVRGLRGVYTYQDVCKVLRSQRSTSVWDNQSEVPYLFAGKTWASYDDVRSSTNKCHYVIRRGLGGVGIWALHLDDFSGMYCNQGKFPLVTAILTCLKGDHYQRYRPHSNRNDK